MQINIPLKYHKYSNSLSNNNFTLRKNIQLKYVNGSYYITLIWYKVDTVKRTFGTDIGIDTGYRKLIATSNNQILGNDMPKIYNNIVSKKRNSNNYKKALKHRDNLVNMYANMIDTEGVKSIIVEDLHKVKHKSRFNNKVNDKISRWTYRPLIDKIDRICEDKGIILVKVSPEYTSQTCSMCGSIHKESRQGDSFKCIDCGYEIDSDYNASINIRNKGIYSFHSQ